MITGEIKTNENRFVHRMRIRNPQKIIAVIIQSHLNGRWHMFGIVVTCCFVPKVEKIQFAGKFHIRIVQISRLPRLLCNVCVCVGWHVLREAADFWKLIIFKNCHQKLFARLEFSM